MTFEGHDVYEVGPSVLGVHDLGSAAAARVGSNWTDTPAPYGPVFLILASWVVQLTEAGTTPAVLGLRFVALGALVLIVWALRSLGGGGGALWLAALNPLLLIHVIAGVHNDGLMIGLMLSGVVLGKRGRWVLGSSLVGLAAMIKSPAVVALLFLGVMVAQAARGPVLLKIAKGLILPGLVAAAVASGTTVLAGTGFGWLDTQGVAGSIHTALSLTSDVGLGVGLLAGNSDLVKEMVQKLGLAVALVLIVGLAWRSWKGRMDPVLGLGLSLLSLVALSPAVQPWYLLWGTVALAAAKTAWRSAAGQLLTVLSAALVYETHPSGGTPAYGFVLVGVVCALGLAWMWREPWREQRHGWVCGPGSPGAAVRAKWKHRSRC